MWRQKPHHIENGSDCSEKNQNPDTIHFFKEWTNYINASGVTPWNSWYRDLVSPIYVEPCVVCTSNQVCNRSVNGPYIVRVRWLCPLHTVLGRDGTIVSGLRAYTSCKLTQEIYTCGRRCHVEIDICGRMPAFNFVSVYSWPHPKEENEENYTIVYVCVSTVSERNQ
jgi:hypothetical protein